MKKWAEIDWYWFIGNLPVKQTRSRNNNLKGVSSFLEVCESSYLPSKVSLTITLEVVFLTFLRYEDRQNMCTVKTWSALIKPKKVPLEYELLYLESRHHFLRTITIPFHEWSSTFVFPSCCFRLIPWWCSLICVCNVCLYLAL